MPEDPKDVPKTPKQSDDASEEDANVARTHPAVYVDAFLISVLEEASFFRLTFGEGTTDERERIRSAIVMARDDVKELVRILSSLLTKTEKETAAKANSTGK